MSPNNSLLPKLPAVRSKSLARFGAWPFLLLVASIGVAAIGLLIFATSTESLAQQPGPNIIGPINGRRRPVRRTDPGQPDQQQDNAADGPFPTPKWELRQSLKRANKLLDNGDYTDGLQLLDNVLQSEEDYFIPAEDGSASHRGLKEDVEHQISQQPPEGLKAYETLFGAKAQHMLSDALSANNIDGVGQVARRYFNTKAGNDATLLAGLWDLDHNQPLAGALCLTRLHDVSTGAAYEPSLSVLLAYCWLRGGEKNRARDVLIELKRKDPGATIRIGAKSARLFSDDSQALPWLTETFGNEPIALGPQLSQWAIFRGDPARNAASAGGTPLMDPHWRVPTTDDVVEVVKSRQQRSENGIPIVPVIQPLAVGDVVLMRTATGMLAVDFATGKRIWDVGPMGDPQTDNGNSDRSGIQQSADSSLAERLWENATLGTLSSDGQSVFMIQEPKPDGMATEQQRIMIRQMGNRMFQSQPDNAYNVLAAYDLPTQGKLRWLIGGGPDHRDFDIEPALNNAYFLGPPLPLYGQLYVIAELKGEITLVVLDAKTGKLQWQQQLVSVADLNMSVYQEGYRRLTGVVPSFADGVIVCPTSAGAVVAVDLATHKLLWGYEYQPAQAGNQSMGIRIQFNGGYPVPSVVGDRWIDSTATIADGRVLITPVEGDQWLYCLSLIDGKLLWKRERGDDIYVAGVHDGKVILVGKRKVEAISLANDGPESLQRSKLFWSLDLDTPAAGTVSDGKTAPPGGAMPSGRGFLSGGRYYLPLSTAEMASIDLDQGKIVSRTRSRKGFVPGNLICYKGDVISLGVDSLDAFYQLEPLRDRVMAALQKNPNDPESLALRGQIELDAGNLADAIHDIRRAYDKDTGEAARAVTRGLLVDAMLAALRTDFNGSRMSIGELEKLISLDSEQAEFLRMLAEGLQKSGDSPAAVDAYLRLADLKWGQGDPEAIDPNLSVRRDRWVEARMESLYAAAPANRARIDALLGSRIKTVVAAKNDKDLREYISYFSFHPTADIARSELVRSLGSTDSMLERQQLLSQLEQSGDPSIRRFATAEMADLLKSASRSEEAAVYYRRLNTEFADQICLDGKTGKQIVAELGSDSPETHELALSSHWPSGAVKHEVNRNAQGANFQPPMPIAWQGERGPFFQTTTIMYDLQQQILGRDGMGREKFRIPLTEAGPNRFGYQPMSPVASFATAKGHLLFVNLGSQLLALDTLRPMNAGSRVLWQQELFDQNSNVFNAPMDGRRMQMPWGQWRSIQQFNEGSSYSVVGPITNRCICISRAHDLIALDPLTGAMLWTWHGVPQGAEVFGDDDALIVAPSAGAGATVLRTADGQQLGKCDVPPTDRRGGYFGRRVLTWHSARDAERQSDQIVLADPWKGQDIDLGTFSLGMRGTIVDDKFLAIIDYGNRFRIMSLDDGRTLVDQHIALETEIDELLVQATPSQFVLFVKRPTRERQQFNNPYQQMNMQGMDTGLQQFSGSVMAFDRATGKPCWSVPAVVESKSRPGDHEDEHISLNEGTELPVIVLVGMALAGTRQTNGEVPGSILCLDRRTGQAVLDEDVPMQMNNFHLTLSGDRQANNMTVNVSNHTFTMQFTDDPMPPAPPYQARLARLAKMKTPLMGAPLQTILNLFHSAASDGSGGDDADSDTR